MDSGRMVVGSGIVIEERINMYAYQMGKGRHVQYHANYSYDSDESVFKCRSVHSFNIIPDYSLQHSHKHYDEYIINEPVNCILKFKQ